MATRKEIVSQIAEETMIKLPDVKKVFQKTLDVIINILSKGGRIELRNFGVFKVKSRAARKGRNPCTGEAVSVPPKRVAVFKPGLVMKRKIKEGMKQ